MRIFTPVIARFSSAGGGPASLSKSSPRLHMNSERNIMNTGVFPGFFNPARRMYTISAALITVAAAAGQNT